MLCDVSGSVWEVARFFIKLVHEMQNQFSRARSFLFVDRINEVTDEFDSRPFEEIVENLKDDHALNFFGLSDFGRAFYQFHDEHLLSLSRDTVLVILGDARTNWFDPQDWVLGEIQGRVHQSIWLNPCSTGTPMIPSCPGTARTAITCWNAGTWPSFGKSAN